MLNFLSYSRDDAQSDRFVKRALGEASKCINVLRRLMRLHWCNRKLEGLRKPVDLFERFHLGSGRCS
jgi:hypothetical protein